MSAAPGPPVLGIDLGGTKILAAVVGADQTIQGRAKVPTPAQEGAEAILAAILTGAHQALDEAGIAAADLAGVCIGSPGPLDTRRGVILYSANMKVRDFPIADRLATALGRPVLLRNDVRVGGIGEYHFGAGQGTRNMLAAFVGTGIGGCVIVDGQVVEGATGNAGEIGHILLKPRGPRCGCGRRGCMEAFASRSAMARRLTKAVNRGQASPVVERLLSKGERIKSKALAAAFEAEDPLVVHEIKRAAQYLGHGLGSLANVLGPELIVIGGGVTEALGDRYLEMVRRSARAQIVTDPQHTIRIELAHLGDDAGVRGAALIARQAFAAGVSSRH